MQAQSLGYSGGLYIAPPINRSAARKQYGRTEAYHSPTLYIMVIPIRWVVGFLLSCTLRPATGTCRSCDDLGWNMAQQVSACSGRPVCTQTQSADDAHNFCKDNGARLCTPDELASSFGMNLGCGFDNLLGPCFASMNRAFTSFYCAMRRLDVIELLRRHRAEKQQGCCMQEGWGEARRDLLR